MREKKYTTVITFRTTPAIRRRLVGIADEKKCSVSFLVSAMIDEYLKSRRSRDNKNLKSEVTKNE